MTFDRGCCFQISCMNLWVESTAKTTVDAGLIYYVLCLQWFIEMGLRQCCHNKTHSTIVNNHKHLNRVIIACTITTRCRDFCCHPIRLKFGVHTELPGRGFFLWLGHTRPWRPGACEMPSKDFTVGGKQKRNFILIFESWNTFFIRCSVEYKCGM